MMRKGLNPSKLLLSAALLATCASLVTSSSLNRERRHLGSEESSHRPSSAHTPSSRSFKSSTSRSNEITTEPGRKVSHRLIGGHLRTTTNREPYEALWDDGILLSSAGNGRESKPSRKDEDDEKKTLSQQVKEGKYGLIQNEIYRNRPKRPGIISYTSNPEVPKDTLDNLGGLDEDEIWLAENHVLVLRGGKFPGHETTQGSGDGETTWPPIDDYKAPRRQVKIPSKPKVPPPFPVQLTEGGPIQIIGPNGTKEIGNGTVDFKKDPLFAKGLLSEDGPLFAIISNGTIVMSNEDTENITSRDNGVNSDVPPGNLPPFYHAIPPGAVFLPPPSNQTDYDEEDQSIYYPPPYSFQYQQDNTTAVPPGPLVPGIILPPPPDFFSPLEDKKTTKKYTKRPGTTPLPRSRPTYLPPRKLTTKRYKSTTIVPVTKPRTIDDASNNLKRRTTLKNATRNSTASTLRTVPYTQTTTLAPEKPTTLDNPEFYSLGPITENRVTNQENVPEKNEAWSGLVTSKTIPIMSYYTTSTQSTLEKPVEVTPASIRSIVTTGNPERSPSQASYYFYEESNGEPTVTTDPIYYKTTTESPFYETVTQPRPVEKKKQYYSVETVPSQETSKDYSLKYVDSVVKNSEPVRYSDSTVTRSSSRYESGSTRTQGQRMLPDRAPLYYQTISARPVQPYYTTPRPQTYYRPDKPKPIYQYSFQAADYSKRGNQRTNYAQQPQNLPYNDYPEVKAPGYNEHRFDYEQTESTQKRLRPESLPYKIQQPVYPSTTANSMINTTPNPHLTYYTHQDEKLLDDVTKEYFTIFGKKLPHKGMPSTTPIYVKSTTERPEYETNRYVENDYNNAEAPVFKTPNVKVHYGDQSQKPYSLKDDILVNYRQPLPPIDPDSEFITVVDPNRQQPPNYRVPERDREPLAPLRAYAPQPLVNPAHGPSTNYVPIADSPEELDESYPQLPISLEDDIKVNYRDPRPTIDPDAEFIDPLPVPENNQPGKPKAYFAYRLPGDGGHFYFLTPQAVAQRPERNTGHLYSKSRGTRLLRRRRRPGNV
ncbi:uncharacterized protein LOC128895943 [Hylaeus anthracinus]|uniref:uncharacterized protein LOC128895943 n=1 Tax=Hylaeus anthracinus TaxID=313031 RepID=UPI0023BA3B30|nr:uncharacterized protein LOC128895943 [Hylaeus anthracinus]XP_054014966.1 uncharacterized protein LOC128895943 [Hylaeus anthracinus]XP_054014974.1 uncharacterized protein LOC128895943 [Hylaeus anthracinus]XP_054014983.1 uncharacterized protein LOC128895943 [Hylaeus anthracinus]